MDIDELVLALAEQEAVHRPLRTFDPWVLPERVTSHSNLEFEVRNCELCGKEYRYVKFRKSRTCWSRPCRTAIKRIKYRESKCST